MKFYAVKQLLQSTQWRQPTEFDGFDSYTPGSCLVAIINKETENDNTKQ